MDNKDYMAKIARRYTRRSILLVLFTIAMTIYGSWQLYMYFVAPCQSVKEAFPWVSMPARYIK